jgi:hypothetical protein
MAAPPKKGGTPPTQPPTEVPTRTGGNGDDEVAGRIADATELAVRSGKDRKALVTDEDFEFSIASLVGSWFHRLENDRMVWQGVVVAEPQPGVYLLQVDKLDAGAENVQRLATMAQLTTDDDGYDWRFYDSENQARSAYARWVASEGER